MRRGLALAILAFCSPLWGQTYEEGLAKATREGKPLVLIVTTAWCGPCKLLKARIDEMKRSELKDAVVVYVDAEKRPTLAQQVMEGTAVPQIVVYGRSEGVWVRSAAIGLQTKDRIVGLVKKVLK